MAFINASESSVNASVPNAATFVVEQVTVVTAGTPVQGPVIAVPSDRGITVQNSPTNGNNDLIFIANSSANALLAAKRVQLSRSQSIVLNVDDVSDIWVNASANGAKATIMVET